VENHERVARLKERETEIASLRRLAKANLENRKAAAYRTWLTLALAAPCFRQKRIAVVDRRSLGRANIDYRLPREFREIGCVGADVDSLS
jgi:hypothetical protein